MPQRTHRRSPVPRLAEINDEITELGAVRDERSRPLETSDASLNLTRASRSGPRSVRASPRNQGYQRESQHSVFAGQPPFRQVSRPPKQIPAYRPTRRHPSDLRKYRSADRTRSSHFLSTAGRAGSGEHRCQTGTVEKSVRHVVWGRPPIV